MPVTVNDILRITNEMTLEGSVIANVFHFKVVANTAADDDAFMVDMTGYIESAYSNINGRLSDNLAYSQVIGQNITQDEILPSKSFVTLTGGTAIADLLPPQVALLVYFKTQRLRTRASTYIAGLTIDALLGPATWTANVLSDGALFGADFVGNQGTVDITVQRGAYNLPLNRFNPTISAIVPNRARTQRRRRPGVGS